MISQKEKVRKQYVVGLRQKIHTPTILRRTWWKSKATGAKHEELKVINDGNWNSGRVKPEAFE